MHAVRWRFLPTMPEVVGSLGPSPTTLDVRTSEGDDALPSSPCDGQPHTKKEGQLRKWE